MDGSFLKFWNRPMELKKIYMGCFTSTSNIFYWNSVRNWSVSNCTSLFSIWNQSTCRMVLRRSEEIGGSMIALKSAPLSYFPIDTSQLTNQQMANISDMAYLGPLKPVALFGPLLKHKQQNPHATLLALFLNATDEMCNVADQIASMGKSMHKILQFLRVSMMDIVSGNNSTAEVVKMFRDNDVLFERYMQATCFEGIGGYTGLKMKTNQTIVAKWPLRLSENPTQREFDLLYWSGHTGSERYVEWHRK